MIFQIIILSASQQAKYRQKALFHASRSCLLLSCVQHLLQSLIPIIDPRVLFVRVETEEFRQRSLVIAVVPLIHIVIDDGDEVLKEMLDAGKQ